MVDRVKAMSGLAAKLAAILCLTCSPFSDVVAKAKRARGTPTTLPRYAFADSGDLADAMRCGLARYRFEAKKLGWTVKFKGTLTFKTMQVAATEKNAGVDTKFWIVAFGALHGVKGSRNFSESLDYNLNDSDIPELNACTNKPIQIYTIRDRAIVKLMTTTYPLSFAGRLPRAALSKSPPSDIAYKENIALSRVTSSAVQLKLFFLTLGRKGENTDTRESSYDLTITLKRNTAG